MRITAEQGLKSVSGNITPPNASLREKWGQSTVRARAISLTKARPIPAPATFHVINEPVERHSGARWICSSSMPGPLSSAANVTASLSPFKRAVTMPCSGVYFGALSSTKFPHSSQASTSSPSIAHRFLFAFVARSIYVLLAPAPGEGKAAALYDIVQIHRWHTALFTALPQKVAAIFPWLRNGTIGVTLIACRLSYQ